MFNLFEQYFHPEAFSFAKTPNLLMIMFCSMVSQVSLPLFLSGIRHLLQQKIQILWASALLGLGFQNLGLEQEFFLGLIL